MAIIHLFSFAQDCRPSGNYSRMRLTFVFARSLGFYIIQVYLPSVLIVIISWVSFWLSRDATPARVALGVTTVLTMTTLMSTTNSTMPKVSYVKSIDIYLGTCFMMVFASLLEYAAVGYLSKRQKLRAAKLQGLGNAIRSLVNPGGTGATGQSSTPTTIGHQLSNNLKPPLSPNVSLTRDH